MKPIFAIMVTHRRLDETKKTISSLLPTLPEGSWLLIVDNCTPDEEMHKYLHELSIDECEGKVNVQILELDSNDGWGAAMNEGLRLYPDWKDFEYVLETNNDVTYEPHWCAMAQAAMEAHPEIGILGGFKHPYHHVRKVLADGVIIKDDMPATAWFMRSKDLQEFLPFPEHGPCKTRGGNGEDVAFRDKVQNKLGRWICGMEPDWAHHMDGYDIPELGKENPAYL